MPSKVEKFLKKLDAKHSVVIARILDRILRGDFEFLDMKKLEGSLNQYRIRKGNIRIQFSLDKNGNAIEIAVDWRNEGTYK